MPSLPHHASGPTRGALRACRAQVLQTGKGVANKPDTARFLAAGASEAHGQPYDRPICTSSNSSYLLRPEPFS
jgi:hypothetical protein